MTNDMQIFVFLGGQILTAAGVYAAIRADLREALVRISIIEKQMERQK
jgi:hypothetical protein